MYAMITMLTLTAGNFLYQWYLPTPDFVQAAERSFFQVTAILIYVSNKWFFELKN